jgi:formylglycine-generating enzyme required for sulfatase activity
MPGRDIQFGLQGFRARMILTISFDRPNVTCTEVQEPQGEVMARMRMLLFSLAVIAGLGVVSNLAAIANAEQKQRVIQDCAICPEMVVVPPGRFRMGDLAGGGFSDERPVREVEISQEFAVGMYEVTFAAWDACRAAGGCGGAGRVPSDMGWGRDRRPVINISWDEAKSYAVWLSKHTGQDYRLLSEAEWEYVARAGTTTRFWWGDEFDAGKANASQQTVPVGAYQPNAFGLYDVNGNVAEFVEDCWHDDFRGAPSDGSAWTAGSDCEEHVVRGGSWGEEGKYLRSSARSGDDGQHGSYPTQGFRVARSLQPRVK